MLDIETLRRWCGMRVVGADGAGIGTITDIYLDDRDDQPRWALVGSGGGHLVPISEAVERDGAVHVPYDSTLVAAAPGMAPVGWLSDEEEAELFGHYGLAYEPRPIELDEHPEPAEQHSWG